MKPKIHPDFHKVNVTCACGGAFESYSTSKELKLEVCSNCHPFFTGQQRFLDTAGRVERFQAKIDKQKQALEETASKKKVKPAPKAAAQPAVQPAAN
ncbi:MAG: 50S ribosomal protein L31 [Candidatus Riflebacteria bacterium]|nr:50S ribosomal protein L31 [Candidatus Riflebacteria bacterium]